MKWKNKFVDEVRREIAGSELGNKNVTDSKGQSKLKSVAKLEGQREYMNKDIIRESCFDHLQGGW